jgi:hypothetical protein
LTLASLWLLSLDLDFSSFGLFLCLRDDIFPSTRNFQRICRSLHGILLGAHGDRGKDRLLDNRSCESDRGFKSFQDLFPAVLCASFNYFWLWLLSSRRNSWGSVRVYDRNVLLLQQIRSIHAACIESHLIAGEIIERIEFPDSFLRRRRVSWEGRIERKIRLLKLDWLRIAQIWRIKIIVLGSLRSLEMIGVPKRRIFFFFFFAFFKFLMLLMAYSEKKKKLVEKRRNDSQDVSHRYNN